MNVTCKLERHLKSEEYLHPKGNWDIGAQNQSKFYQAISPFLIPKAQLAAVTQYLYFAYDSCSFYCRDWGDTMERYRFVDEGRFQLSCGHFSLHIQCVLSHMVHYGQTPGLFCPMSHTEMCRGITIGDTKGELYYWGPRE